MALNKEVGAVFLHTLFWSLLSAFTVITGSKSDIYCLKSIKDSLEDPYHYLNSWWNFDNTTEGFICNFAGVECWHPNENRVLNLRLSDMGLKGQFPPGMEYCSSLTGLDLSRNELQGPIPLDIAKRLPAVTSLDLSFNNFTGEIPSSIANCSYLNLLKLNNNRLTGHIPREIGLLHRIKSFSVANNLLSGPVPIFVGGRNSVTTDSYANNRGLCGGPLESCTKHQRKFDWTFKSGFLIGYVVSAVSVITVSMSYCVPWVHAGERNKMITVAAMAKLMIRRRKNMGTENNQMGGLPAVNLTQEQRKQISMLEKFVTRMNFMDLVNATENFSEHNIIGLGQIGTMYKAMLPNGWFLAVKRLHDSQHFEEQFASELKTLGRLRHDNLVPLLGFCLESKEKLLVYKYMSNGNLFDWLHSVEGEKKILEWPLRVKIAIGLARCLAWLHHGCNFSLAHLNISSKCILLDQNFEPKLSNFGRAILVNLTSIDLSRSLSIDSGIWGRKFLKRDVFNFGIVLLELVTGRKPINSSNCSYGSLAKWMNDLSTSSSHCPYDAIDKSLIGQGFDGDIVQLLQVALNCVLSFPEQRPTMLDVCKKITAIGEGYGFTYDLEKSVQIELAAPNSRDGHVENEITEIP